jgi:hypothetical protein
MDRLVVIAGAFFFWVLLDGFIAILWLPYSDDIGPSIVGSAIFGAMLVFLTVLFARIIRKRRK